MYRGKPPIERFEMQFRKAGPDDCWIWLTSKDPDGYGRFKGEANGVMEKRAHRFSYRFFVGDIPPDKCVCHSCDNPPCVNPAHLFLGSNADNIRDKLAKNRHISARGVDHYKATLTEEQVREILKDPRPYTAIASDYGVRSGLISNIKNRHIWAHVDPDLPVVKGSKRGSGAGRRGKSEHITPEIVREIRSSTRSGRILAEKYGVSIMTISDIRRGKSWKHVT
jgi:hypothetical protein